MHLVLTFSLAFIRAAVGLPSSVVGGHSRVRSFSYDEMQSLGLSRAIDEYHKLLAVETTSTDAEKPKKNGGSTTIISSIVKSTVLRPLPRFLRPEAIAGYIAALWRCTAVVLVHVSPLLIPLCVWFLFGTPLHLPAQLLKAFSAADTMLLDPPKDWRIRGAIVAAVFVCLRAAEAAVARQKRQRETAAASAVTPQALEALYSGCSIAGTTVTGNAGVGAAGEIGWEGVIADVRCLSRQYEDNAAPISDKTGALLWLERVAKDVGLADSFVLCQVEQSPQAAMKSLQEVRQELGA